MLSEGGGKREGKEEGKGRRGREGRRNHTYRNLRAGNSQERNIARDRGYRQVRQRPHAPDRQPVCRGLTGAWLIYHLLARCVVEVDPREGMRRE